MILSYDIWEVVVQCDLHDNQNKHKHTQSQRSTDWLHTISNGCFFLFWFINMFNWNNHDISKIDPPTPKKVLINLTKVFRFLGACNRCSYTVISIINDIVIVQQFHLINCYFCNNDFYFEQNLNIFVIISFHFPRYFCQKSNDGFWQVTVDHRLNLNCDQSKMKLLRPKEKKSSRRDTNNRLMLEIYIWCVLRAA